MSAENSERRLVVQGTELLVSDSPELRAQKLARITLNAMVQFVGLLDAQGTVLEINKVALDAVGITLDEVRGKPFWSTFWWQVSDEINQELRASIARAAQGEFVRWDTSIYGRAGGKETIVIDASLCPVTDEHGKVVFICAEGRDISAKKAQEREIAQKNLELSGLLERIRELDEIKTQFFANVSHELRTPLALILGPAQRLIDDDGSVALAERREGAQVIVRNARMLLKHVNDLLDMSRLEAGKLKMELADTDVAALVRLLSSQFVVLAEDREITFEVLAEQPCVAAVDPDKLQRVLMNLLGNAFKFVPQGGRIRCSLHGSASGITLAVDDSGPGVELALRGAIFERFRQGEGGIDRKAGGTGLGLAIAKEFVELHKGHIHVLDSDLGGARFEVVLPARRVSREEAPASTPALDRTMLEGVLEELRPVVREASVRSSPTPGSRPRILVVEDNPDMNRFVAQCVAQHYDVISAFDGLEGLEKAKAYRPTLVVSDIMMPVMSGVEMIAALRALPELANTPVLLLSAKADEELRVKLLDEGAQDFIVKPFSEHELIVRIRNLVHAQEAHAVSRVARDDAELQKRLLHSLFMQAPTLIAVLRGPDHVVELANPPICTAWGVSEESVRERPLFDAIPVLHNQMYRKLLRDVFHTGRPYLGRETPATFARDHGQRETVYFDFVYSPYRGVTGDIEGVFVIASDVTDQVLARDELRGLRDAAESANRAKDEFMAMLGHELRNPLSPIMTALHVMKMRDEPGSLRERTVIERQVSHLARLVDDLLDVSRIARGKVELRNEHVEISRIVRSAIELASPLIEQRNHTLRVDVAKHGLCVEGDVTRLSQVVSNLLTNAAKYTPPHGDIAIRAERVNGEIVLSVRDTGIGIAPDVLPRVFDLFVQERQALDRSQGGLGIGLSIVKSLVERHGGSVSVHSDGSGKGSEFMVRLNASDPPHPPADPTPAGGQLAYSPEPVRPARVLVVDDNEDGAEMLALVLNRKGYDTRVAHDAPAALVIAAEFLPEVAFLDIGLPVIDGYELAARLRALPGLSGVFLIALTGYGQESDRQKAKQAGFHHHFVKPVDVAALAAMLEARPARADGA